MADSDAIPANGCFEGHERVFRRVFIRHYADVRRLLAHLTRDCTEAEDLTQEVFLSLLHHRFAPGQTHNLRRWLHRVALNRGLNAVRSGRRREDREKGLDPPPPDDVETVVERRRTQDTVRATLAELDPRAAKILMLHQVGFSHAELAEVVDVAAGDDSRETQRKLANERAGLAAAPDAEGQTPSESAMRYKWGLGDAFERRVAAEFGADAAREMRHAFAGWGSKASYGGRQCLE